MKSSEHAFCVALQFGGWSVSQEGPTPWSVEDWDFQTTVRDLQNFGLSVFFNVFVSEDEKNVERNVIQVLIISIYCYH